MTGAARSTASVIRKIIAAVILVPLAVVIIAFAVANRQIVTVSLDPFSTEHPAASLTLPLFALVIVLLVLGVLIGGIAAWLRQSKWRRTARRLEREIADLHIEIEALKGTAGVSATSINAPAAPPERLQLRPPL
ncbi:MAG TPA: lipopolysaccharide assembly protein LapA domain-containing protein [Xanthobacteraceae bacterium]|nr:lipopolysaccharide assembly protein LapA domain-containing protein [Xanthobacteraceae bacterium]